MTGTRKALLRLAAAVVFVVPSLLGATGSSAAPSKAQVEAAKQKLSDLNQQLEGLVALYDQQLTALQAAQAKLQQARQQRDQSRALADSYTADLAKAAVQAYTGMGSQLDVLLGASSFTQFSDRMEFMGRITQSDSDLAAQAAAAQQQARWAAQQYNSAVQQQQKARDALLSQVNSIKAAVAQQQRLYTTLHKNYTQALAAEKAAERAAQQAANGSPAPSGGGVGGGGGGGFVAPPNATAAQIAIDAAKSVIGTPYVWGGASPQTGFDCSGLVMWAYAQAGISMPHSSFTQYDIFPHVSRDQLQPGDLVFFYGPPPSHVGLYVGGGQMIDANHTGGSVGLRTVYWSVFIGGARPS
jgi:cell wall-associated NlpC family hydrolase